MNTLFFFVLILLYLSSSLLTGVCFNPFYGDQTTIVQFGFGPACLGLNKNGFAEIFAFEMENDLLGRLQLHLKGEDLRSLSIAQETDIDSIEQTWSTLNF